MTTAAEGSPGPLCEHCGYSMHGAPTRVCPECGRVALGMRVERRIPWFAIFVVAIGAVALAVWSSMPEVGMRHSAKPALARAAIGKNGPLTQALDAFKSAMGVYPTTNEGLAALYADPAYVGDENYRSPFLQGSLEEPRDPWGNPYEYRSPGTFHPSGFDLWSRGPDGVDNGGKPGSDDISNW